MEPMARPRVKICCIASVEEARLAVRHGASALGLVSEMPSGPGVIPESTIAEIARTVPPAVGSFLLTSKQDPEAIAAQQRRCGTNTIQLCDRVERAAYRELRAALPGVALVQVIHVTGPESLEEALEAASEVHGLLLDSGNPALAVKQLGGTGRVHDWNVSRRIRERSGVPVFLAGGLRPENIGEALREVQPFGVDLCSGVRTGGRMDEAKLAHFFRAIEEHCAARSGNTV
jgi:phosphoribosylanthranilate isomerase